MQKEVYLEAGVMAAHEDAAVGEVIRFGRFWDAYKQAFELDAAAMAKLVQGSPHEDKIRASLQHLGFRKFTVGFPLERHFFSGLFPSFPGQAWDRFFKASLEMAHGARIPIWLDLAVTGRCHCDGWHGFRSKYKDTCDMPLATIERVFREARALGTSVLGITGGEPMLRDDILDILHLIPEGMEGWLHTTGYRIDESFVQRAMDTRMVGCLISIDHHLPEVVNKRRNHATAFEDATWAVRLLAQSNLYTTVTLCATEDLCEEEALRRYIDFVAELGADELRVTLPVPQGKPSGKDSARLYLDARRLLLQCKAEAEKDPSSPNIVLFSQVESRECLGCGAGCQYLSINNEGSLTPCVAVPLTFGNVETQSLSEIYDTMATQFRSSGGTCFGKRLNRVMMEEGLAPERFPFSLSLSRELAAKCLVDESLRGFYKCLA